MCEPAEQPQRRDGRVQVDTGNPGRAHTNSQCREEIHRENYTLVDRRGFSVRTPRRAVRKNICPGRRHAGGVRTT
jgi:hypothetical protein